MKTVPSNPEYPFLAGGGEMGKLIRATNWTHTPVGSPDEWPQSLRTTLGLLLLSAPPMLLFWGDQLTCFYNDAFRNSLGRQGEHPALGTADKSRWSEHLNFIAFPMVLVLMKSTWTVFFRCFSVCMDGANMPARVLG